jgi:hypothetical protein
MSLARRGIAASRSQGMPRVDLSLGDREFSPSAWCLRPRLVADHAPGSSSPVRSGATPRDPDRFEQAAPASRLPSLAGGSNRRPSAFHSPQRSQKIRPQQRAFSARPLGTLLRRHPASAEFVASNVRLTKTLATITAPRWGGPYHLSTSKIKAFSVLNGRGTATFLWRSL